MENYLHYLEQVLGLKSVLLPEQKAELLTEIPVPNPDRIQVLFLAEKSWSPKALELFQKMREAMKLDEASTRLVFADQVTESHWQVMALSAERVVCFSKPLFESLNLDSDLKTLTYDPELLLKKPDLKKAAWEDLK